MKAPRFRASPGCFIL